MSDTTLQYKTQLDGSGFASGAAQINSHLHQMGISTNAATTNLGGLGDVMGTISGGPAKMLVAATLAVGAGLYASVQAAAAWETSMSGVAKTSGLSGAALESMSQQLLTMSTEMPITASALADIASAGGSLGIGQSLADAGDYEGQAAAMAEFAEVASQMGIGFGMAADQAATAGAKILNSFGQSMDSSNLEKLGSVVNTMGDSFAATEPQVLEFLNRASFLNSTMGQSIPQVAALGTTLISTGMEAETASTGIKSFLNMATSATSKTGGMDNWAKLMGTSVSELKTKLGSDLNSTLIETANKIVAIEDPVERFQAAVALAGSEGAPALLKLAGQQENYTKALGMSNEQWEKASSLQKTYDAQSGTLNSQWTMFTNTLSMAATELGTAFLPDITSAVSVMTELTKEAIAFGEAFSEATGVGQSGGISAKINELTGGLMGQSAEQQEKYAATLEREKLAAEIGKKEGISSEEAKIKAEDQIRRGNEAARLAEEALAAGKEGEARAKASADAQKKWMEANAGYLEAGMAKLVGGGYMSWDAINQLKREANGHRSAGYAGLFGRDDATVVTSEDSIDYEIRSSATKTDTDVSLWVDGQKMAEGSGYGSKEEAIRDLFNQGGFPLSEAVSLDLQGRPGDAAKIKVSEGAEIEYDYNAVLKNIKPMSQYFSDAGMTTTALKDVMSIYVTQASASGKEAAEGYANAFAAFMANPDMEGLAGATESSAAMQQYYTDNLMPVNADLINAEFDKAKEVLRSRIVDTKSFVKAEMDNFGTTASDAIKDGIIGDKDVDKLLGLEPTLLFMKQYMPEEFYKTGGEMALKLIAALKEGDYAEAAEYIGTTLGDKTLDIFGQEIKDYAPKASEMLTLLTTGAVSDIPKYAMNTFQPEVLKEAQTYLANWNSGVELAQLAATDYASKMANAILMNSQLFTPEQINAALDYSYKVQDVGKFLGVLSTEADNAKSSLTTFKQATDDMLSDFGNWQEGETSGVFKEGYIGASYGTAYDNYLKQKANEVNLITEANERAQAAAMGIYKESGYTESDAQTQTKTINVVVNGTEAMTYMTTMNTTVSTFSGNLNPLKVSTSAAQTEIDRFTKSIELLAPVIHVTAKVNVDAYEIQLAAETAISNALQNVRIS